MCSIGIFAKKNISDPYIMNPLLWFLMRVRGRTSLPLPGKALSWQLPFRKGDGMYLPLLAHMHTHTYTHSYNINAIFSAGSLDEQFVNK